MKKGTLMQIQKINYNSPTFGYNRRLNAQLNKKLSQAEENDDSAKIIKELNDYCINSEGVLRHYDSIDSAKKNFMYLAFVSPKVALAQLVHEKYPELNYIKREKIAYETEVIKNKKLDSWQSAIASELCDIEEIYETYKDEPQNSEKAVGTDTANKANSTPSEKLKGKEIPDVIEKFEPTFSSPEGFKSLGGMDQLKEELTDKIIYPALHPEEAKLDLAEYGKRPPRGVMLYGPPGCGKTSIVEALSQEASLPLFKLKISKAGSPYINQTSGNYQKAFDYVADYSAAAGIPCLLFIDELDGLTKGRDKDASAEDLKQIGTLLNLIETGRDRGIIVLGATNKYDIVDVAIKRRFDDQIYIGMPDMATRQDVLHKTLGKWLKGIPLAETPLALEEIAQKLDNFPTSAIVILADKASTRARKDGRRIILKEDFFDAIEKNQNLKIKEDNYQTNNNRKKIGFR